MAPKPASSRTSKSGEALGETSRTKLESPNGTKTLPGKSAYELAREERLKQNRLRMMQLGLNKTAEELHAKLDEVRESESQNALFKDKAKPRKAPKRSRQVSTRVSKRVRGLGPDGKELGSSDADVEEDKEKAAKLRKLVELYGRW